MSGPNNKTKLKPCKYCGGSPMLSVRSAKNYMCRTGYEAQYFCTSCGRSVFTWAEKIADAIQQAEEYWNGTRQNAE